MMLSTRLVIVSVVIFALFSNRTTAQSKFQRLLEVSYDQGPIVNRNTDWSKKFIDAVDYSGMDIRIGWRKKENDYLNYVNRYPILGVGFSTAVKYYDEMGRPMGLYAFAEFPFGTKSYSQKLNFSYFSNIGIGFNMNPYNVESNPTNLFVGSSVNAHIHFGFKANYQLSRTITAFASAGLKHYSNGSIKKPNSGINFIPIGIGLRLNLDKEGFLPQGELVFPPLEKRGFWNVALYTGLKSYEIGEASYFRGGLGVNYLWQISYKYRGGLGLDWFYGAGTKDRYPGQNIKFSDRNSFAVVGSWEWKVTEKIFFPIGFGVYLSRANMNQEVSWFYERIGIRYRINEKLSTGVNIKAHQAKADFFEFTLGYTIPGKVRKVVDR